MLGRLTYDDNHIDFLRGRDDVSRCPQCGVPTHPFDHGFPQKKTPKSKDLSSCFESFALASPRLKEFLERHCTSPVKFHETGGGYFILQPLWSVFEDLTVSTPKPDQPWRKPPRGEEYCSCCGRFNAFYGFANGIMAGQRAIGEFDLVRTVQEYGHEFQKNFRIIAGSGLFEAIKDEGFKGIDMEDYPNPSSA